MVNGVRKRRIIGDSICIDYVFIRAQEVGRTSGRGNRLDRVARDAERTVRRRRCRHLPDFGFAVKVSSSARVVGRL